MSSHTRILRREFTGKILTNLKITDNCVKTSLLAKSIPKAASTVVPKLREFNNGKFLLELGNVLSSKECAEIIENTDKCILEDLSEKYRFGNQRSSSRLLALDARLTENLWKSINEILLKEIQDQGVSTQPLGFDVTRGVWELHGLNEAIRINKYSGETKGFFGPHKDAQFCPNGDERSIMTLLVYLNDDFQGGETCFYFPNDSTLNQKGMTIKEEIDLHGGMEDGYKCVKVVPKVGHAVLSSQSILHEALTVINGTKYILKTDVVVKRCSKEFGFAVAEWEKKDYMMCLNYFREAQQQELSRDFDVASDLYEKALSIRYCYPDCSGATSNDIDTSGCMQLPLEMWSHVMKYLSGYDAQNLVYAYPELRVVQAIWEQQQQNTSSWLLRQKFLPQIRYQKGVLTSFEFPDADFFREHKTECCRVASMYSFFLLGHSPGDDVYTVRYNPDTQEVCVVALEQLLADVFYGRRCYGSVYNVRQQDPEKRAPKKDFESSVDRSYMLVKHGTEFTGMELPGSFNAKTTAYRYSLSRDDDDDDDDDDNNDVDDDVDDDDNNDDDDDNNDVDDDVDDDDNNDDDDDDDNNDDDDDDDGYYDDDNDDDDDDIEKPLAIVKKVEYHDNRIPFYGKKNDPMHAEGFRNYFKFFKNPIIASSAALVSNLKKPTSFGPSEICICFISRNIKTANQMAMYCSTEYFNHLVFDFQESQLNVEFLQDCVEESDPEKLHGSSGKAAMQDMTEVGCTGELIACKVDIEPVLSPKTSFNHASCQCGHPRFEVVKYCTLKEYLHIRTVMLYAKEKDGKMMVWTVYDGIVAL